MRLQMPVLLLKRRKLRRDLLKQSLFFYFHHETNFPKRTITQSTTNYLMGLCHSHDLKKSQDLQEAAALAARSKVQTMTTRIPLPPIVR